MRNAFLISILLYILLVGCSYPFVAGIAYLWIDIVKPQNLGYQFLNTLPLSMIAAVVVVGSYALKGEKGSFKLTPVMCLLAALAVWVTFTSYMANPLLDSWTKWNWVFKGLVFTIMIPLLFRTRVQIEAFLLAIVFSLATISFSAAVKTALGGGGYGVLAVLGSGDSGMTETSTLSAVSIMILPVLHYLYRYSVIFPDNRWFKRLMIVLGICSILTMVGTSARTGLVAAAFLLFCYVLQSKNKTAWFFVLLIALGGSQFLDLEGTRWGQRMSTINSYEQESSAAGRLKVWEWTLGFVAQNPMGGGFDAFRLNGIRGVDSEGNVSYYPPGQVSGKAFHSIYFEVLGEQGIPGFVIYIAIMLLTFIRLWQIRRIALGQPGLEWVADLALRLRDAQGVLLVGGMFIGIGFQPVVFYLVAITIPLSSMVVKRKSRPFVNLQYAKAQ